MIRIRIELFAWLRWASLALAVCIAALVPVLAREIDSRPQRFTNAESALYPALVLFGFSLIFFHPYRFAGAVPVLLTLTWLFLVIGANWNPPANDFIGDVGPTISYLGIWFSALAGFVCVLVGMLCTWNVPARAGVRTLVLIVLASSTVYCLGLSALVSQPEAGGTLWMGVLAVFAWILLFRPTFELLCDPVLRLMYRVEWQGYRGLRSMSKRGPCIVIANHACWFDPLFLAKVLPRPITPMMTSRFYDIPFMRPLLQHVFHVIRVPEQNYKKQETPDEIHAAIAALDRGECLVMFPEGALRRSDDKPLKRFGRGIWQILVARPDTPVYCCWIEGGWGSWASYWNGKPTKNKKPDVRRRISVAVPEPIAVSAETLAHHLTTRIFLMNRVLESRKLLGLPDIPPFELPKDDATESETPNST